MKIGPTVFLPNNQSITSNATGNLPIPTLSTTSTQAHILPGLKNSSLLSLGQLCDDGCQILLDKKALFVVKEDELVMEGYRNEGDLLWDIPVQNLELLKAKHATTPAHA